MSTCGYPIGSDEIPCALDVGHGGRHAKATTDQQYRVIGKSGPGVEPRAGMVIAFIRRDGTRDDAYTLDAKIAAWCKRDDISGPDWNAGEYEILEAISPPQAAKCAKVIGGVSGDLLCNREAGHEPMRSCKWEEANGPQEFAHSQAAPVVCLAWCGLPVSHRLVPAPSQATRFFACIFPNGCHGKDCGGHRAYCTQACLDRAKAAKAPECIRSACKAPPVAGGVLCAAHAGQVETVKAKRCAWEVNGVSACDLPRERRRYCPKHSDEYHAGMTPGEAFVCPRCQRPSDARDINPVCLGKRCVVREANQVSARPATPAPAEARLERWRREHKGYSHGTADPRVHDANVAAMMVGRDGPREPYVPPPKLLAWTPRDLDGDVPDAWEPGGARLGR